MRVQCTDYQPPHPVTTTTTHTTTHTTTTTTVNNYNTSSAKPSLATRPVGWHATASGFDWNKRSDQHHYRLSVGLPEVHAAVINQDWQTAEELLSPNDIGLLWLPPVSQHDSASTGKVTENGAWASALPSKKRSIRLQAIRQMASDLGLKTHVNGVGCVYGANLLTLCLQTSAPTEFMEKLIAMIKENAPRYLNLPDASGRTPLYIAVDRNDEEQIRMLLDAGASPYAPCRFPAAGLKLSDLATNVRSSSGKTLILDLQKMESSYLSDKSDDSLRYSNASDDDSESCGEIDLDDVPAPVISALDHALASQNCKPFTLIVEYSVRSSSWPQGYPIHKDPLQLEKWASLHSEDEVRAMASQFNVLKSFLFNVKDKSGSSIVDRTLARKEPLDKDVTPLYDKDPELGAIYAVASYGHFDMFIERMANYFRISYENTAYFELQSLFEIFLRNCDSSDISRLLTTYPQSEKFFKRLHQDTKLLLSLPFENFSALLVAIWPSLNASEREFIACMSGGGEPRHTRFIISLPEFAMERNGYASNHMALFATQSGNSMAFDVAAYHQDIFVEIASGLKSLADPESSLKVQGLVINTLRAKSLHWFEKFIDAGLNLRSLIDSNSETIVPLMADLSPDRLSHWLKGITFKVTDEIINNAQTKEGKDALENLAKLEKSTHQKTDTKKLSHETDS